MFLFPTVILGTFFTNGETPFCNTSIFHIVKGSFCTFVTERSAYMEMFILRLKKKRVEWFQYILFSIMLFIHFSAEETLQLSVQLTCVDATSHLQRRETKAAHRSLGPSFFFFLLFFFVFFNRTLAVSSLEQHGRQYREIKKKKNERERTRRDLNLVF